MTAARDHHPADLLLQPDPQARLPKAPLQKAMLKRAGKEAGKLRPPGIESS